MTRYIYIKYCICLPRLGIWRFVFPIRVCQTLFHCISNVVACEPFAEYTVPWVEPLGTESAYQSLPAEFARFVPSAAKTAALALLVLAAQVSAPPDTEQKPLLDFSVNPLPEEAAVNVAQVPDAYQAPLLMMQPFVDPPVTAFR